MSEVCLEYEFAKCEQRIMYYDYFIIDNIFRYNLLILHIKYLLAKLDVSFEAKSDYYK